MCHAAQPVWEGIGSAPKGVMLDTADRIKAHAAQIALNSVLSNAMPPGNITELPAEERGILAAWIKLGHDVRTGIIDWIDGAQLPCWLDLRR